ncbi:MAG: haloacid dehalogenase-like hydrolase, partial [Phycisphaeraceae bacterium]
MPLCVDMDGTLVRTDLLWESVAQAARRRPLGLAAAATRLFAGRAAFKRAVADVAMPGADALPYREELITRIKEARAAGRRTVLATASERRLGEAVAGHLGCFDE